MITDPAHGSGVRQGLFQALGKEMKNVAPEDRPVVGKAFNVGKNKLQAMLDKANDELKAASDAATADSIDLTLPGRRAKVGRKHPVTKVTDDCVAIFRRMGFIVATGPVIETVYHNFDALNTPDDHPSRDVGDTFSKLFSISFVCFFQLVGDNVYTIRIKFLFLTHSNLPIFQNWFNLQMDAQQLLNCGRVGADLVRMSYLSWFSSRNDTQR